MKTIIISSRKGGAGKTTLSLNLATHASQQGRKKVALLDLDPQGSSQFWDSLREADYPDVRKVGFNDIVIELSELDEAGYDYVFIDMPPTDKKWVKDALQHADLVLIPTKASPLDIHSASSTLEWASDAGSKVTWVINGASVFSSTPEIVFEQLKATAKICRTIVHERNDFVISVGLGKSVTEFAPNSKAAFEIDSLWKEVRSLVSRG
ncbi:ParA family protein [Limnobacter parvus]|uniref:ParA family protein n=1 Tax=Limnobacter parvus TaxID=2939690 RepID=A0ABT1XDS0_9BURK|nr:ParA family protein [Limnobacter parvus]MCR2745051.1 ParA family protein [Limnobacter parvus]